MVLLVKLVICEKNTAQTQNIPFRVQDTFVPFVVDELLMNLGMRRPMLTPPEPTNHVH